MIGALHLTIATPMEVVVDTPTATSVRAEDESGGFGIWPGHVDYLTALPASVVRWHGADGAPRFCAIRSGLMTVADGTRVSIACREAILGDDLHRLEDKVRDLRAHELEEDRKARVEHMRLHASAVRQMMRYLRPDMASLLDHPPSVGPDDGRGRG
ncbi:MAG: F0F1 ATP synthase subunit epsilon [Rhodobacteraceae bacterium]|nr:F0F1 ATP synthase subunit epsilon [Paracoccaceae bacterium]MAY47022.1 F0F1 ATP synthase subunit epsilon [Paracoccaceae bacterium]QEW18585.1 F0F1 ATP synthase subunit epsilon [Marinibacterium anthonyi]